MPNIIHRIGTTKATPDQMYNAVTTIEGLSGWWTLNSKGDPGIGGVIQFRFSKGGPDFQVIDAEPFKRVEWRCIQGPKEWIDTHIEFDISDENGETVLLFKHGRWREEVEFMYHCSTQWAYFLISLRKFLETGKGTPYGSSLEKISEWSK